MTDLIFNFLATYFGFILIFLLIIYYIFSRHRPRQKKLEEVIFIATSTIVAWLISATIKLFYYHPRPGGLPGNSFPSGHATLFFALGYALYLYRPRLGVFYLISATLIGISRVVIGVHWPGDVLAGFILGAVTVRLLKFLWDFVNLRQTARGGL